MDVWNELWEFEGPVEYHDFGRMGYTVVYLPEAIRQQLPLDKYPRLRVDAEVNEQPIDGALQPGQGKYYLMLSKRLLKAAGLTLGDTATVNFRLADQDAVTIPEELQTALAGNPDAKTAWDALTPGKRRGLAHRVASARTAPTRFKRVAEVLTTLQDHQ
ncbi:MAG: YdeI/OmpD-associated family protein [Cyanobacteria bacterium J06632_22]